MGSTGKSSNSILSTFRGMTTDEAANWVYNTPKTSDPRLNNNEPYQDVVNALGLHGRPVVLDDKSFDSSIEDNALEGRVMFRGIGKQTNSAVADSIKFGDKFYVGSGYAGGGLYFSDDFNLASGVYSNGNVNNSILTGYVDKNKANPIDRIELYKQFAKEPISTLRLFGKMNSDPSTDKGIKLDDPILLTDEAFASYALYKGYNVITFNSTGFDGKNRLIYNVLTRDILVFRDKTPKGGIL